MAAWMPAKRATSSGFPLGFSGSAAITAADSSTKAEAVAVRRVGCLPLNIDHGGLAGFIVVGQSVWSGFGHGDLSDKRECGR